MGRPEFLKHGIWSDNGSWLGSGNYGYARCSHMLWFGDRLCTWLNKFSLRSSIVCGSYWLRSGVVAAHLECVGSDMLVSCWQVSMACTLLTEKMLCIDGGLGSRMDDQPWERVRYSEVRRGSVDHSCFPYSSVPLDKAVTSHLVKSSRLKALL